MQVFDISQLINSSKFKVSNIKTLQHQVANILGFESFSIVRKQLTVFETCSSYSRLNCCLDIFRINPA